MKKRVSIFSMFLLSLFALASCGEATGNNNQGTTEGQGTTESQGSTEGQGTTENQGSTEGQGQSNSGSTGEARTGSVNVDIYAFNDTHGNLKDTQGKGIGIAKMSTLLDELTEGKNSVLVHQGDMWQGSIESNYTNGNFGTEWLVQQGFVSMTVGNHEFDWGPDVIKDNREKFDLPILGINVVDKTTRERVDYLDSSVVVEREGLKIGVIGAIGNCLSSISASNVPGIDFAKGSELTNLVKAESTRLKEEEGCDFIIYSLHGSPSEDNDETYDVSLSTDHYVDLVLEGHTHSSYDVTDEGGVHHIQARANNESFYQISLTYNFDDSTYEIATPVEYKTGYTSSYMDLVIDGDADSLFNKYESYYLFAYEELGNNSSYRAANVLKNLCSRLYLEAGVAKWGSEYDIILGGGYTSCRGNGLVQGSIIYAQIAELFPFNNNIALCSIKGSDLKNTAFYTMSNSNYYVTWANDSIKNNIQDNETYYLITDTYNTDYRANKLTIIEYLSDTGKYARDLIAEYIKNGGYDNGGQTITFAHAGTIADPRSVADALIMADAHTGKNATAAGAEYAYIIGKVSSTATQLGSTGDLKQVYIQDLNDSSKTIMIYWLSKTKNNSGSVFTSKDDLKVGDEIVIYGAPFNYNGNTLEIYSGAYCYSINGTLTAN